MVIEQIQESAAKYYTSKYIVGGVIAIIMGVVLAIIGGIFLIISKEPKTFILIAFGALFVLIGIFAIRYARRSAEFKTGLRRW